MGDDEVSAANELFPNIHFESDFEVRAASFAIREHSGQVRKYTGEPYIIHPAEVASIVKSVPHTPAMVAAAWLHDTIEDCGVTAEQICQEFNCYVSGLVEWLTDVSKPSDGNRAIRKAIDRAHTAKAPPEAKTVKLADLISNTRSIVENDPKFAKIYLQEKSELLKVLSDGDAELLLQASELTRGR